MSGYSVAKLTDAPNSFEGKWPGELRPLKDTLGSRQVAVTYRKMPRHSGAKGGYGHFHREQEELVYVTAGKLQFKLDEDIIDVTAPAVVRISPNTTWGMWNEQAADAELLIISNRREDDDFERVENFWPE